MNQSVLIDREQLATFLDTGDISLLNTSIYWSLTPQGYDHWCGIYLGRATVSEEDRAYLQGLLNQPEDA